MTDKDDNKSLSESNYLMFFKEFTLDNASTAVEFIITKNLIEKNRPKMIKMLINSPGGDVASCFSIVDTMKGSKIPVYTYGLGEIASCGLLAFVAGRKGSRFITENTSILSHQFSWLSFGKEHELMATVKEFNNTSMRILNHYKKCTGLSEKDIKKYLLPPEDVWLTAQEAVKYGLADAIVDFY